MSTKLKRITFVVTPEIEILLNSIKKEKFYNSSHSTMIRELVLVGAEQIEAKKAIKN